MVCSIVTLIPLSSSKIIEIKPSNIEVRRIYSYVLPLAVLRMMIALLSGMSRLAPIL
jgi:hypothetical protein